MDTLRGFRTVAQGGDWGYLICRYLAFQYPQSVRAIHVNYLDVKPPTLSSHPIKYLKLSLAMASNGRFPGAYTPQEVTGLKRTRKFYAEEAGYSNIHRTKPMTLAYGLTDSPVGLLAWMREKMHSWTDNVCPTLPTPSIPPCAARVLTHYPTIHSVSMDKRRSSNLVHAILDPRPTPGHQTIQRSLTRNRRGDIKMEQCPDGLQ